LIFQGFAPSNIETLEKFTKDIAGIMSVSRNVDSVYNRSPSIKEFRFLESGFKDDVIQKTKQRMTEEIEELNEAIRAKDLLTKYNKDPKNLVCLLGGLMISGRLYSGQS
jgi:hypothetical protein